MTNKADRMNTQQPNSAAPPVKPNRPEKGRKHLLPRCLWQKWHPVWEADGRIFDHWTKQLLSQERTLELSVQPRLQDQAIAPGFSPVQRQTPGSLSKPDCLVPTWSPTGCTSCKEKRPLADFAHSCSSGCPFSGLFLLCFLHSWTYTAVPPDCHTYKQYCILRKLHTLRIFIPSAIYQYCWIPDALLYAI